MFPQVTDEEPGAPHRPSRSATAEIRPAPSANRSKALPDLANLLLEHGGATGVAYAWELQLLAENKQPGF